MHAISPTKKDEEVVSYVELCVELCKTSSSLPFCICTMHNAHVVQYYENDNTSSLEIWILLLSLMYVVGWVRDVYRDCMCNMHICMNLFPLTFQFDSYHWIVGLQCCHTVSTIILAMNKDPKNRECMMWGIGALPQGCCVWFMSEVHKKCIALWFFSWF